MSHVHQISNEYPTNFGGDNAIGVPPQLKLWGGRVPPVPNRLTPLSSDNVGVKFLQSVIC